MIRIRHYIDGELTEPASGRYLDNVEPATGKVYSQVPDGDERDVERAVTAAIEAFPRWSATPAGERSRIMLKIADLLEVNLDRFAEAESRDNGKPLKLARSLDIPRAVTNLRFFATAILHTKSESHVTDSIPFSEPEAQARGGGSVWKARPAIALNYTLRQPRGVAGLISPWNLPLYLFTWKVAPAIAVGNTAVAKPSEITPMTAYLLSELCQEASLPPGVLNIVHGLGTKVGAAIVAHPKISTISFTGGTKTGGEIARVAGSISPRLAGFKKVALELGGKNPNIVFADSDPEAALTGSVRAAFANQGQVCLCGSRLFIEKPIYASFVERFVEKARALRIGDPLDDDTDQGAVVSGQHLEKIASYVALAKEEGGTILCGGGAPAPVSERCRNGFFFEPTVIGGLSPSCRVNKEEIFGPVVSVMPFWDEEEVIDYANSTQYGLSASVWTKDVSRAHRIAERIIAGTVWINCWLVRDLRVPFGGMKQSGLGREGGEEALRFFTEPKNVCIQI